MKHTEIKIDKSKLTKEDFVSFNELVSICEARKDYNAWASYRYRNDRTSKQSDWAGSVSYNQAIDFLIKGWDDKTKEIMDKVERISAQGYSKTNRAVLDVVGFSPCVPNAILGLPKSMYSLKPGIKQSKIIEIVYDATVSCRVDADKLIKKGVQLVAKINSLEMAGYRVRLSLITSYCHGEDKNWYLMTVPIKSENQPLNIAKVAFPLSHPAMLRIIGFDWYESLPNAEYNDRYGCSIHHWDYKHKDKMMEYFTSENQHYINYYTDLKYYKFTKEK